MGGKTWSMEEERFFWQVIVPQSPQAVAESDRRQSWESCAAIMQREMGKKRLRDYTRTMLYEHYYQNVKTGSHSPRARDFVREHSRQLKIVKEKATVTDTGTDSLASSSPSNESLQAVEGSNLQGNYVPLRPGETMRQNEEVRCLKRQSPPELEESAPKRHLSSFQGLLHDYRAAQKFPFAPQAPDAAASHGLALEFQQAPAAQTLEHQTLRRYDAPLIPDMDRGWRDYPVLPRPRDPALSALLMATTMRPEEHSSAQTSDSRSESASPISPATDPDCGVASETAPEAGAAAPKE